MLDRLPLAVLAALVGWCLGWASAVLAQRLQTDEAEDTARPTQGRFIPDPIVQGASALVWAALAVFLASEEASYVTGHVLNVNGGILMG